MTRLRHNPATARREPRKRFGQHFLAPAWADKVIAAIAPQPSDRFLEVGPGPGVLTTRLAGRAASVVAVEIDRDLARDVRAALPPTAQVIEADFLAFDPAPLLAEGPLRVAGNLPYNISSPILFKLLAAARCSANLVDATLMLQLEVAERLVARPGTKDYGVLTIFASVHADIARLLTLPPGAFRPPPQVHSAVVRLSFKPAAVSADDAPLFERMVRGMFTQRRKTLSNALRPFAESVGAAAGAALTSAGIDPQRRPETLALPELLRLMDAFKRNG